MRIFVTGASGFIGSALIPELAASGHQVLGLVRSEAAARQVRAAGADCVFGDIEDLDSLRRGAAGADGVIHLAFSHDFSQFEKNAAHERAAITALGEVLLGSDRPFVVTSGTALADGPGGAPSTEEDGAAASPNPRAGLEAAVGDMTQRGVTTSIVRLAQIHDTHKQGLVPYVTALARDKGVCAYLGDGANRWPAAHVSDTARLYRLALEKAERGAIYHAVDEEGIPMKTIAEALGRGLNVPVVSIGPEAMHEYFGWLAMFAGRDMPSSSAITRRKLGWAPQGPGLIADLDAMDYTPA